MKTVSLRIADSVLGKTEEILSQIRIPRNRYFNEAIAYYNKIHHRRFLEKKLESDSALVRKESIEVLREFEGFKRMYPLLYSPHILTMKCMKHFIILRHLKTM